MDKYTLFELIDYLRIKRLKGEEFKPEEIVAMKIIDDIESENIMDENHYNTKAGIMVLLLTTFGRAELMHIRDLFVSKCVDATLVDNDVSVRLESVNDNVHITTTASEEVIKMPVTTVIQAIEDALNLFEGAPFTFI